MEVIDLGRKTYSEVWELQKHLVEKRAAGEIPDTLVLVEHEPVYTAGRGAQQSSDDGGFEAVPQGAIEVRKLGMVPVIEIERGGKLTFHGPGQIVGYPIFALTHRDLRTYLRDLERVLMQVVSEQALLTVKPCPETLFLEPGQLQTGVWTRDKKLASIGIAVRKWVSFHGFALNVSTDLRYFEAIDPCGFNGSVMTTLEQELGGMGDMKVLTSNLKRALAEKFLELSKSYECQTSKSNLSAEI